MLNVEEQQLGNSEQLRYLEGHCHGSVLHQFCHHGQLTAAAIKPPDVEVFCSVGAPTVFRNTTRRVPCNVWEA